MVAAVLVADGVDEGGDAGGVGHGEQERVPTTCHLWDRHAQSVSTPFAAARSDLEPREHGGRMGRPSEQEIFGTARGTRGSRECGTRGGSFARSSQFGAVLGRVNDASRRCQEAAVLRGQEPAPHH